MSALNVALAGIEPGSIFGGKYRIEKLLGTGGMGIILLATHTDLEQKVAIKVLTAEAAQDPERVGRFQREAKAAARIKSDHVVRILDYGTHSSGAPFIVMEHLDGTDLAIQVKQRGGLPIEEAVDCIVQACEGVAEAHHAGIIHRDLKPANLFVTRKKDGTQVVKVLDFGASKLTAECSLAASDAAKTHASALIGSPRYMAPEQLKAAHEIDDRADVYALGATLFELLAGEPVFKAESISRIFTKILWDAPPSIYQFREDVPQGLSDVLEKSLAKRPEDRQQSVKEFVEALAPFVPEHTKPLVEQIARIGRASIVPTMPAPSVPKMKARSSSGDVAPPPSPKPAEVSSPERPVTGSLSMSTMSVLRAARADGRSRIVPMIGLVLAMLGLGAAIMIVVVKPRLAPANAAVPPSTTAPAATMPDVPPPPAPTTTTTTAASATTTPPAATDAPPVTPAPTATAPRTGARHTTHHSTPTATTSTAPVATTTAAPTSTGGTAHAPFSEFGNRK